MVWMFSRFWFIFVFIFDVSSFVYEGIINWFVMYYIFISSFIFFFLFVGNVIDMLYRGKCVYVFVVSDVNWSFYFMWRFILLMSINM